MDNKKAADILRSLAYGKNPETGLELDNNDVLSQPDVIRALNLGSESLKVMKKKRKLPDGAGKRWEAEEDNKLTLEYHSNVSIQEMAKIHQRTTGAISSRLVRLGLMEDRYTDPRSLEGDYEKSDVNNALQNSGESTESEAKMQTIEEVNNARDKLNQENDGPKRHNYPQRDDHIDKDEEPDETLTKEPITHGPATIEKIIGRNPDEEINHYEVRAAGDSQIGGTREDTKRHRGRNYGEMINRK